MAKICLIYFDLHTGYYPSFHHGLAYLIGSLKNNGHSVYLSHLTDENEFENIPSVLKMEDPDVVGLSFTTNQKKYVHRLFEKSKINAKLVIAGGVHATLVGEQIFEEFPDIDGVCIGEGEIAVNELCLRLDNNESYLSTPSFYFKNNDDVIKNPVLPLQDIDNLPFPDYSLFGYQKIIEDSGQCFPMMLSRGCPYNCNYCCNHVFKEIYPNKNKYVRFPSIDRTINVIKNNLLLYPRTKKIIFADDTFTLNKKWLAEFCKTYRKKIGLPFLCNARVETISNEVVALLKDAGCVSIDFGVETGNEWLRNNILNRKHSNRKIKEAFHITKKHGIKNFSFNIVGLPFETKEMARDTLKLNLELQPNFGRCFYFYPYPGSRLYQLCIDYGLLLDNFQSVSSYLEAPSLKEIFMSHREMKKHFELMQSFFYARLLFSKIKIPFLFEKFLLKIILLLRKPILIFLDPTANKKAVVRFRKFIRKLAMKYLR
ncbi:hypothetical protein JZK55_12120 [Dissulfurispira thermophila]|uniref:Uncharacterized protein n=2 Tax=root TaxID=1 RepID=A0A7G1H0H6_9BACT|nr:radical SAM protein [Dissulfurispira thermophila]BCB96290.1 hypothetical protein JZK55_12120 [Dissulfurispira thermophila]